MSQQNNNCGVGVRGLGGVWKTKKKKEEIGGLTCIEYVPPGVIGAGSCEPSWLACVDTMFRGVESGEKWGFGETRWSSQCPEVERC